MEVYLLELVQWFKTLTWLDYRVSGIMSIFIMIGMVCADIFLGITGHKGDFRTFKNEWYSNLGALVVIYIVIWIVLEMAFGLLDAIKYMVGA